MERNHRFYEKATKPPSVSEVRDSRLRRNWLHGNSKFNDQGARSAGEGLDISKPSHQASDYNLYKDLIVGLHTKEERRRALETRR